MQDDNSDILALLETWYARSNGQYLLEATRQASQEILDTSFGYHLLQLGVSGSCPLSQQSPINHRLYCAPLQSRAVNLVANPDELPLEGDSVDAVIAHHCLEFAANPHQVLREIHRVLIPQGQLLVIGFNPFSLLGCATRVRGLLRHPLWSQHRPVGQQRLTDWLHLLDCEVLDTQSVYNLPLFGHGRLRQCFARGDAWMTEHNLPLGGVYILHATKKVAGLNRPQKPLLGRRSRLIGMVPKPAATPTPRAPMPQRQNGRNRNQAA